MSTLSQTYQSIRQKTVALCAPLETEDYVVQPAAQVSPPKWHLAHTSWFFENFLLVPSELDYPLFSDTFAWLFNSYYKGAGEHCLQGHRGMLSRPTVKQIMQYRQHVDEWMLKLLANANDKALKLIEVGLHHEQQHQELLLMDIKAIFFANPETPSYSQQSLPDIPPTSNEWQHVDAGVAEVGHQGDAFAYDHESPRHKTCLIDYALATEFVTNYEYMAFIDDGGYQKASLWLSMGWDWVNQNNITMPAYWQKKGSEYLEYTLHGLASVARDYPVCHISYFEADAFARWQGHRLPTEFEIEHASLLGDVNQTSIDGVFHPTHPHSQFAPLWAWTQSQFSPYPGYKPLQGVLGEYNGKFMCNQFVLRGGCFATPAGHYRHSYRNFYEPHQRWMFSGIRLAKDL